MRPLRRLARLSHTERSFLVKAAFLLGAIRIGLWVLPFSTFRRLLRRVTRGGVEAKEPELIWSDRAVWAVKAASRYMPWAATCLTRALATQTLLMQLGQPTHLRIGVSKDDDGRLQAHAWVESRGKVVIGGLKELSQFTPLRAKQGELS